VVVRSIELIVADFGEGYRNAKGDPAIQPRIIGFMSSCYQLGSILAVPVAPWLSQKYGRRMSIFVGSVIMVIGAVLQGFAQHGMFPPHLATLW
jgi:MFS family permease